jgi:hypothetical protein
MFKMFDKKKLFVTSALFVIIVTMMLTIIDFEISDINRPSLSELTSNNTSSENDHDIFNESKVVDERLQRLYADYKGMPEPSDSELLGFVNDMYRGDDVLNEYSESELIELGRQQHPYYVMRTMLQMEGFEV